MNTGLDIHTFMTILVSVLFVRTVLFHLELWQRRDYRWDRLREHLMRTTEGRQKIWNLWFFKGMPRPALSGRLLFILFFFGLLLFALFHKFYPWDVLLIHIKEGEFIQPYFWILLLVFERLLWAIIASAVLFSRIPADILKERLFIRAQKIIDTYENEVIRIGITGSYGKSTTKEILVHLLNTAFGPENVLYNPKNHNTEVALARLLLNSRQFFTHQSTKPKIIVLEMGAYGKGEIERVCQFFRPHISILTGVNNQHIPLFGSQRNIQEAKFELAHATREKVFFNAESALLKSICEEKQVSATLIPLSFQSAHNITPHPTYTEFEVYGETFHLPWRGEFFVLNALLALETARELDIPVSLLSNALRTLPPLERALSVQIHPSGAQILVDPYSANLDGVLSAVDQLRMVSGKRIFVGIPMIELGNTTKESHRILFEKLRDCGAYVFWMKPDYSSLGKQICGEKFIGDNTSVFRELTQHLSSEDIILFESRIPQSFQNIIAPK